LGVGLTTLLCKKKLLRSLQEIQPDFEEEAKAHGGMWRQGKKKKKKNFFSLSFFHKRYLENPLTEYP
jgi:hypothetical protein